MFKPYAGVSTAILLFTRTNSGGTDFVWFYDCDADGWSLDDKRTPLLSEDKLGPARDAAHRRRAREEQAFARFLGDKTLNASQIEFVNLIVDHLTEHGVMSASLLYESPFTDVTPRA